MAEGASRGRFYGREAGAMSEFRVVEYQPCYQVGVDEMMEGIAGEFVEAINGPQSTRLGEVFDLPGRRFWVALVGERVVGTVGLELLSDGNAVLKRMMTDRQYRGASGLAALLLGTALEWGRSLGVDRVYLGTMVQFKAAQRFYVKHGFVEVALDELPGDMSVNPIDGLFYRLNEERGLP
jgi:GNAT superfamily N-acetyltransferase